MRLSILSKLIVCSILSASVWSQEQAYMAPLVTESLLLDVTNHNGTLYAVGERGHIVRSEDAEQWEQLDVPTTATLTAINFVGDSAWVVGHDAIIMHLPSVDGQWQIQKFDPDLEKPLLDVLMFDKQQGIAIGAYGLFFRTEDGGQSWQKELHPEFLNPDDQAYLEEIRQEDENFYQQEMASILPHLNRVTRVGERLYLAGEIGLLAFSDDMGRNWQRMDVDYFGSFFDINANAEGRVFAAGLRGHLFELDLDNLYWMAVETTGTVSLNSIVDIGDDATLVVGNNGNVLCISGSHVQLKQTENNQAIINAVPFKGTVTAVTAGGIQQLDIAKLTPSCAK